MKDLTSRVKSIQNTQESLRWGSFTFSENETMFAVGHRHYPNIVHYFTVSSGMTVSVLEGNTKSSSVTCVSEDEVLKEIIGLLKKWYPTKSASQSHKVQEVV